MSNNIKQLIAQEAAAYLLHNAQNTIIGMGTGTTVNELIKALVPFNNQFKGAVSTSIATENLLRESGINVYSTEQVQSLDLYIDGADEITPYGNMIKGGGGALSREKIIASIAKQFICIADSSKQVNILGKFALPIEVIPVAYPIIYEYLKSIGANPILRKKDDKIFISENHAYIIDAHGLIIDNPLELESKLNNLAGVITNGIFAQNKADILITNKHEKQNEIIIIQSIR